MRNDARLSSKMAVVVLSNEVTIELLPGTPSVGVRGAAYDMPGHSSVGRRSEHEKLAVPSACLRSVRLSQGTRAMIMRYKSNIPDLVEDQAGALSTPSCSTQTV